MLATWEVPTNTLLHVKVNTWVVRHRAFLNIYVKITTKSEKDFKILDNANSQHEPAMKEANQFNPPLFNILSPCGILPHPHPYYFFLHCGHLARIYIWPFWVLEHWFTCNATSEKRSNPGDGAGGRALPNIWRGRPKQYQHRLDLYTPKPYQARFIYP